MTIEAQIMLVILGFSPIRRNPIRRKKIVLRSPYHTPYAELGYLFYGIRVKRAKTRAFRRLARFSREARMP